MRVFILGAGFSKAAGMPLATELTLPLLERVTHGGEIDDMTRYFTDLRERVSLLRGTQPDAINVEELFQFARLDEAIHRADQHRCTLDRDAGDTPWAAADDIVTFLTYLEEDLVVEILEQQQRSEIQRLSAWAQHVRHDDQVVSFNYDTLAEHALTNAQRQWTHSFDREAHQGIPVFKMHGSADWLVFDRGNPGRFRADVLFEKIDENAAEGRMPPAEEHEFYSSLARWQAGVDITNIYRQHGHALQSANAQWRPALAGLGPNKQIHQIPGLGCVWRDALAAIFDADHVVVIGFALSDFDALAQMQLSMIAARRRAANRSLRVTVIDPASSGGPFCERYMRVFGGCRFIPKKLEEVEWPRIG